MKKGVQRKGIFLVLVLLTVVLMLFVACSNAATTPPKTTATTSAPTTTATTTKATTTPAATTPASTTPASTTITPKSGGILKYGYNQDFPQIGDPPTLQVVRQQGIYDICLESLFMFNRAGEVIPWLATGYKYDASAPSLTLTLRKGVKFHDGTDFNATAVKWNLDKGKKFDQAKLAGLNTVDVIDDYTVRLNLAKSDTLMITYLAMQSGLMMSPTAYEKAGSTDEERSRWAKSNPVGTGPFIFVSWERQVKLVFKKNNDYWQKGKPYLAGVEFTIITNETTLLASFKAGELDVIMTEQPSNIKQLEESGKYNMVEGDIGLVGGLEPDSLNKDSPWSNIKVRQAAAYAVDTVALSKAIGLGYYIPTQQLDAPGRWGYNNNVVGYPFSQTKAKQLLTEAGYPNGFDTNFNAMIAFEPVVTAYQGFLSEVGIKAKPNLLPPPKMVEMYTAGWSGINLWQVTCQPNALSVFNGTFQLNALPLRAHSLYVPPEYQDVLSQAVAESDFEKQKALTQQLQSVFVDKYCVINFAYAQKIPTPTQKYVHDLNTGVNLHWTPWDAWLDK
jgi:peptide/nickel transport system substrate-binding protein